MDVTGPGRQEHAEALARDWTQQMVDQAWSHGDAARALSVPSPVPGLSLDDIAATVIRLTDQVRVIEGRGREVPVVVLRDDEVMPVNLDAIVGPENRFEMDFDNWMNQATQAVDRLAKVSGLSYDRLPGEVVVGRIADATLSIVTARVLAFGPGGSGPRRVKVTVHVKVPDLRVNWSLAKMWEPNYFGYPTPTVENILLEGRYQFGVDSDTMEMRVDDTRFDISQSPDVHLMVP